MTIAVGLDGYPKGWVAVVLEDGVFLRAHAGPTLAGIVGQLPEAVAIGVDIPVGLPLHGRRAADLEARTFVGPRRQSVFFAVPLEVWAEADHDVARTRCLELTGSSVSAQALALGPKVLEADVLARVDARLHEVHPEVSFTALAGRHLAAPKSSWAGARDREALLRGVGIEVPDDVGAAGAAGVDDVLDAAVVAWTSTRIAAGSAGRLGTDDSSGGEVAGSIWY